MKEACASDLCQTRFYDQFYPLWEDFGGLISGKKHVMYEYASNTAASKAIQTKEVNFQRQHVLLHELMHLPEVIVPTDMSMLEPTFPR